MHVWLQDSGVDMEGSGLSIGSAGPFKGLGVFCAKELQPGKAVLTVPRSTMLTFQSVTESPLGQAAAADPVLQSMPMFPLALFLLTEVAACNATGLHADEAVAAIEVAGRARVPEGWEASGFTHVLDRRDGCATVEVQGAAAPVCVQVSNLTQGSAWRPFLALLPWTASNVLFWNWHRFHQLAQGGGAGALQLQYSLKFLRNVVKMYSALYSRHVLEARSKPTLPGLNSETFTWAGFKWALSMVMSRQNMVPCTHGPGQELALVPGWDLLNYEDSPSGSIPTAFEATEDGQHRLVYRTPRAFAAGEELCMYYGPRPNRELLHFCGFVADGQSHDVPLVEVPAATDPLAKIRKLLLKNVGMHSTTSVVDGESEVYVVPLWAPVAEFGRGVLSLQLASWSRVTHATKPLLQCLLKAGKGLQAYPPLSEIAPPAQAGEAAAAEAAGVAGLCAALAGWAAADTSAFLLPPQGSEAGPAPVESKPKKCWSDFQDTAAEMVAAFLADQKSVVAAAAASLQPAGAPSSASAQE